MLTVSQGHSGANVTLERAWLIVNDARYRGHDFPEYDRLYPIEREATVDGFYAYSVRDAVGGDRIAYADSSLQFASADLADQEAASRALYGEHLTILQRPVQGL